MSNPVAKGMFVFAQTHKLNHNCILNDFMWFIQLGHSKKKKKDSCDLFPHICSVLKPLPASVLC